MAQRPDPDRAVYLVDGSNTLYRAFYAIRGLSTSKGLPTNAIYGFTSMLRKLIREHEPRFLGVAFDLAGPTFRHQAFAEGEEALIGWPAVTLFLHRHGVRNAYGKQVTAAVLRRWRRRFGFPLLQGRWKRTPPLTSTYLVLAWLVSLMRSGEPDGVAVAKVERGG